MFTNKVHLQYGLLVVVALLLLPSIGAAQSTNGVSRMLAIGDSLSVGIQPDENGVNQRTDDGYPDQLLQILDQAGFGGRKLKLIKLGCPGETTVTMQFGGICDYDEGSQLAQALVALRSHKDKIALITIDMGANDILAAGCVDGNDVDIACIVGALNQIGANLPIILTAIRQAAPNVPIVGMNLYNPFLAAWLTGPEGQALAMQADLFAQLLNLTVYAPVYGAFGIPVADAYGAFNSDNFTDMVPFPPPFFMVPLNVATLCALTWNCALPPVGPNIHPNVDGYGVLAGAFAAEVLP
jgi:lysophospholipase L1-like esterase